MSLNLPRELDTLIFRGLLLPGDDEDSWLFLLDLAESTVRGEVSPEQARALCDMLGLSHGDHAAAVERARRVN
jgi:hypothetical protein